MNWIPIGKTMKKDKEKVGMEEYRWQWGLDICKVDNGQIQMSGIWTLEDGVNCCESEIGMCVCMNSTSI
jgi:hypothetical protein